MTGLIGNINQRVEHHKYRALLMILPMALVCGLWLYQSVSFPIHDYANSYFPAEMSVEGIPPETLVFDIYDYNRYIWHQGYSGIVSDFYLNSPFTATFFYPFALLSDAHQSKFLFNTLSIFLFLYALWWLFRRYQTVPAYMGLLLPFVTLMALRNQVLFGQSYMVVFALVIMAFMAYEKHRGLLAGGLLGTAIMIKVFPVFYAVPLLVNKRWRDIGWLAGAGLMLLLLSIWVSGSSFWQTYLFEVMPNAFANESTTDFRPNAQSVDTFLRILLVHDVYYNPGATWHAPALYKLLSGLCKGVVLGFAIMGSYQYREHLFRVLAIWVVALFLVQSRTGTYAQILWIIPTIEFFRSVHTLRGRLLFIVLLGFICNFPFPWLADFPLVVQFARLWATLALAAVYVYHMKLKLSWRLFSIGILVMLPLTVNGVISALGQKDDASYVLKKKEHFVIYDFRQNAGFLEYSALGKGEDLRVKTDIEIGTFDSGACTLINGQIYLGNQQISFGPDIKKKPVLVDDCEVYYLTDHKSRRGAFTLKKIRVCTE